MWKRARQARKERNDEVPEVEYEDEVYLEGAGGHRNVAQGGSSTSNNTSKAMPSKTEELTEADLHSPTIVTRVLDEVHEVNKEALGGIVRIQRLIDNSETAGEDAIRKIQKQKEQLVVVNEALEGLDPLMERAKRDISSIARRMARDKCFIVLCLIVLALLITAIVVAVRHAGEGAAAAIIPAIPALPLDNELSTQ